MKKILCFTMLLANAIVINSQGFTSMHEQGDSSLTPNSISLNQDEEYPISRFALSINPLGFVQFGPTINAEFGLNKKLVLNANVRIPSLGLISYVVSDKPDKLTGFAYGGGLIYFFGKRMSKPYVGIFSGYQIQKNIWNKGTSYESSEDDKILIFFLNGGYRFRFKSGFFINTGAYVGIEQTNWVLNQYGESKGTSYMAGGMLEVTLGYEF